MNLQDVHQLLETHFRDHWDSEAAPAKYDNTESRFREPSNNPWVHFQVLFGAAQNQSRCADGISVRQSGSVQLYIYVPLNIGSLRANGLADDFRTCFMNKQIGKVTTLDGFIATPELISNRFQSRVSIPFFYSTK